MHILQRGVFDINRGAGIQFAARVFDPPGDRGNFRLRRSNLCLAFLDLRVEIGHRTLRL